MQILRRLDNDELVFDRYHVTSEEERGVGLDAVMNWGVALMHGVCTSGDSTKHEYICRCR